MNLSKNNFRNSKFLDKKVLRSGSLIHDVRFLIEKAREQVARTVNSGLAALYWHIGKRIEQEILKGKRAGYGEKIVATLSQQLQREYGMGFNKESLHRMVKFSEVFPNYRIVATLSQQLSWSHFVELIHIEDSLKRDFYAEMCRLEKWSIRILRHKIGHMLYERTAVAKKPKSVIKKEIKSLREQDQLTPDMVFKDPYFLGFLNLKGAFQEKDLETAILREMESFILEMGDGFSFVARQKRISIDAQDYYLDLLFYHRRLKRLVAIELKLDRFKAEYKGQMELYLKWLDRHEKQSGEESPIGLILCSGKSDRHIELLELDKSGIRIAEYMTELPSRKLLEKKLYQTIKSVREACVEKKSWPQGYKKVFGSLKSIGAKNHSEF